MSHGQEPLADDDLVARTVQGDRDAFGEIWDRHHLRIYGICRRSLDDNEAAEDATAETFRKALVGLSTYRCNGFRAWLNAIARNVIADELRRRRGCVSLDDVDELHDMSSPLDERVMASCECDQLADLLRQLTPEQREVIKLRLAGFSPTDIANMLDKSRAAVDMAGYRALIRLRELLAIEGRGGR